MNQFPPLKATDFERLKADIAERGVIVPIEIDAETGELLDGVHRQRAADELGISCPTVERSFASDADRQAHVLALNLYRRHLTPKERGAYIADLRAAGMSLRSIAEKAGAAFSTVGRDLKEAGVPNRTPERVTGRDGKSYPATQKPGPRPLPPDQKKDPKDWGRNYACRWCGKPQSATKQNPTCSRECGGLMSRSPYPNKTAALLASAIDKLAEIVDALATIVPSMAREEELEEIAQWFKEGATRTASIRKEARLEAETSPADPRLKVVR